MQYTGLGIISLVIGVEARFLPSSELSFLVVVLFEVLFFAAVLFLVLFSAASVAAAVAVAAYYRSGGAP